MNGIVKNGGEVHSVVRNGVEIEKVAVGDKTTFDGLHTSMHKVKQIASVEPSYFTSHVGTTGFTSGGYCIRREETLDFFDRDGNRIVRHKIPIHSQQLTYDQTSDTMFLLPDSDYSDPILAFDHLGNKLSEIENPVSVLFDRWQISNDGTIALPQFADPYYEVKTFDTDGNQISYQQYSAANIKQYGDIILCAYSRKAQGCFILAGEESYNKLNGLWFVFLKDNKITKKRFITHTFTDESTSFPTTFDVYWTFVGDAMYLVAGDSPSYSDGATVFFEIDINTGEIRREFEIPLYAVSSDSNMTVDKYGSIFLKGKSGRVLKVPRDALSSEDVISSNTSVGNARGGVSYDGYMIVNIENGLREPVKSFLYRNRSITGLEK